MKSTTICVFVTHLRVLVALGYFSQKRQWKTSLKLTVILGATQLKSLKKKNNRNLGRFRLILDNMPKYYWLR